MSGSHWKDRFSEKQLEKKRLSDKINQRRTRQQSKRTIAELECRLRLLLEGEKATLINQIQRDNARLRAKIWRYRCQMENMFNKGKDCLQQDDGAWGEFNIAITTQPTRQDMDDQDLSMDRSANHDVDSPLSAEQRCVQYLMKMDSSLFVELAKLIGRADVVDAQFATNEILESIMVWKSSFESPDNEFTAVLTHFALDQEPFNLITENVKQQALSKSLFQDIMENLLYGEEHPPRHLQLDDMIAEGQMPETQHQRRAMAYCAYESLRAWRKCFKSSLEYIAIFWAQYRYFLVLAFPTAENFYKCPIWRRPIPEQFRHDHPGVIDFIIWPKIREKLLITWQQYDLPSLYVSLVQSFELKGFQADAAMVIMLQSDAADVVLDKSFEQAINDVGNFVATSPPFADRYPDLAEATVTDLVMSPSLPAPQYDRPCLRYSYNSLRKTRSQQQQKQGYLSEDQAHTSPNASSKQQSELTSDSASDTARDQLELPECVLTEIPRLLEGGTDLSTSQLLQEISPGVGDKFTGEFSVIDFSTFPTAFSLNSDAQDWPSDIFNFDSMMSQS